MCSLSPTPCYHPRWCAPLTVALRGVGEANAATAAQRQLEAAAPRKNQAPYGHVRAETDDGWSGGLEERRGKDAIT